MWRKRGLATGLVGDAVERREHVRNDHGGRSPGLGAWVQDHCRPGFDLPEALDPEHWRMRVVGVLLCLSWLAGCGGADSTTASPPAFSYNGSRPFPAVVGEAIALSPAVSGPIDGYAVSPGLPPGLSLDRSTGVISGTPTTGSGPAIFSVTATYRGGHRTFPLVLSVTEPPSHLSYPSPAEGTVGVALRPLIPGIAGTVDHYAVTPALPPGVVLDSTSGLITGTPSVARTLAPYTITASSLSGKTSFILLLTVAAPSPRSGH